MDEVILVLGKQERMFDIDGLDHVALNVRDVARSVAWYREALDFEVLHGDAWTGVPAVVGRDGWGLALFPVQGKDPLPRPGRDVLSMRHVAFRVTAAAFAQARAEFAARGLDAAFQDHGIAQSIYVTDPDGHEIEFTTYEMG